MAGFTDAPMRLISSRFGAVRAYTEMVNAAGLVRGAGASWQLLETLPGEPKPIAHLYGTDPEAFAKAAEMIAATGRFCGIDINAGCPAPKIVGEGAGSALMRKPKLIGKIVAAVKRASGMPVSVKTRIGFNPSEITVFDVLKEVEENGGSALAVHGRYRAQGHAGPLSLDIVAEVKRQASIPVYGNGGVRDYLTAKEYVDATGIDGLLVGQGAIGHPWVFSEIRDEKCFPPGRDRSADIPLEEIRALLFEHIDRELAFITRIVEKYPDSCPDDTPEMITVIRFRVHLFRYLNGLKGVSFMRGKLSSIYTLDEVRHAVDDCLACEAVRRSRKAKVIG